MDSLSAALITLHDETVERGAGHDPRSFYYGVLRESFVRQVIALFQPLGSAKSPDVCPTCGGVVVGYVAGEGCTRCGRRRDMRGAHDEHGGQAGHNLTGGQGHGEQRGR